MSNFIPKTVENNENYNKNDFNPLGDGITQQQADGLGAIFNRGPRLKGGLIDSDAVISSVFDQKNQ